MRVNPLPASTLAFLLAALLAGLPAQATPGPGDGQEHKAKASLDDRADPMVRGDDVGKVGRMGRKDLAPGAYFNDRHRAAVRAYYASHGGKACPPGLAKKDNGCLPPGQAGNWHIGERLPATVVVTPVPQPVLVKLPPVPPGYRYVQAASDILLVAVGSQMVVDGITGLVR